MGRVRVEKKGPVLILSRHRGRTLRVRELLEADRFEVLAVTALPDADMVVSVRAPTVIVIDWDTDGEPPRLEVIHHLRPRQSGARLVVLASGAEAEALEGSLAVPVVVGLALDAEEVTDAVWRAHNETIDARAARGS